MKLTDEQIDDLLDKIFKPTIGINVREQHRRIVQGWFEYILTVLELPLED